MRLLEFLNLAPISESDINVSMFNQSNKEQDGFYIKEYLCQVVIALFFDTCGFLGVMTVTYSWSSIPHVEERSCLVFRKSNERFRQRGEGEAPGCQLELEERFFKCL